MILVENDDIQKESVMTIINNIRFVFDSLEVMESIIKLFDIYGPEPFKVWLGTTLGVTISKPEDVQVIVLLLE